MKKIIITVSAIALLFVINIAIAEVQRNPKPANVIADGSGGTASTNTTSDVWEAINNLQLEVGTNPGQPFQALWEAIDSLQHQILNSFADLQSQIDVIELLPGPQGEQGIQGIKGDIGDQGDVGPAGPQGIQGLEGPPGLQGLQGMQGEQGLTGPTLVLTEVTGDVIGPVVNLSGGSVEVFSYAHNLKLPISMHSGDVDMNTSFRELIFLNDSCEGQAYVNTQLTPYSLYKRSTSQYYKVDDYDDILYDTWFEAIQRDSGYCDENFNRISAVASGVTPITTPSFLGPLYIINN